MKYLYLFALALIFSSCNRNKYVEIDGSIPGINNGAVIINDQQGPQLVSAFITDGKFHAKVLLQMQGFYDMYIVPDIGKQTHKKLFEVYLEPGNYTINADKDRLDLYPTIKSDSKDQNQLSEYYSVALQQQHVILRQQDSIADLLYGDNTPVIVKSQQYNDLLKQLNDAKKEADTINAQVLSNYITKNPNNDVEAFILSQISYKKNPKGYYNIYQKFTAEQKKTPIGQEEGDDLSELVKSGK